MSRIRGKRFGILMTFSLAIMLAMGFYYFHIQSVKEDNVRRMAFKTLYRYAGDLKEIEREVKASKIDVQLEVNTYLQDILDTRSENLKCLDSLKTEYILKYGAPYPNIDTNIYIKANTHKKANTTEPITLQKDKKKIKEKSKDLFDADYIYKTNIAKIYSRETIAESDSFNYLFYPTSINHLNNIIDSGIIKKDIQIAIEKDSIFQDVLRNDFFAGFIAFDSKKTIYNQFPNTIVELKRKKNIQSVQLDSLINVIDKDNAVVLTLKNVSGFYGIKNPYELQVPIVLKGEPYELFMVKVDGIKIKYVAGLIPKAKYASLKRGFDRTLISAITVFVLLLLFCVPVIQLFVIAPGEAYAIKNLRTLVISTLGLIFIICYFVLYESNISYIKTNIKKDNSHLDKIADSIRCKFKKEFDTLYKSFVSIDKTHLDAIKCLEEGANKIPDIIKNDVKIFQCTNDWQEFFITRVNKKKATTKSGKNKDPIIYGKTFRSFHNKFRYTEQPKSDNIDITSREYFKRPDQFTKNDEHFGFQSIFSLTTLKPQIAISKKIDTDFLACLIAELKSVNNTILPDGYSFCIIDSKGKVWFHKDPKNNTRENLFTETDDHPNLIAALKSYRKDVFKAHYKMKPVLMHVEPLYVDLDLFIVTMSDINNYTQIINHAGYIIIAGFLLLFLFWYLFSWLYRVWRKFKSGMNNPLHTLLFFFPIRDKTQKYISLFILNSLIIVLWLIVVLLLFNKIYVIHWISLLALIGVSCLVTQIRFLDSISGVSTDKLFSKWFLVSPVIFLLIACTSEESCVKNWSTFFSLIILLVFNAILYLFLIKDDKWLHNINNRFFKVLGKLFKPFNIFKFSYNIYIYSLLVVFILVPLFVLYAVVFHQETTIYYMGQQRHVANLTVERRVVLKEWNNRDNRIPELEKEGNYYKEFNGMNYLEIDCDCTNKSKCPNNSNDLLKSTINFVRVFGHAKAYIYKVNNTIEDRGNKIKASYINSDDNTSHFQYYIEGDSLNLCVKRGGLPHNSKPFVIRMEKPKLFDNAKRYLGFFYSLVIISILFFYYFPIIATKYLFPQFKYAEPLFTREQSTNQLHKLKKGENRYIVTMPDMAFYERCIKQKNTKMYGLNLSKDLSDLIKQDNNHNHFFLFIDHTSFRDLKSLAKFVNTLDMLLENKEVLSVNLVCFKTPSVLIQYLRDTFLTRLPKENDKTRKKWLKKEQIIEGFINSLSYFSVSYVPIMEQPLKESFLSEILHLKENWKESFLLNNSFSNEKDDNKWEKHIDWIDAEIGNNAVLIDRYKLFMRQDTLTENTYQLDNKIQNRPNYRLVKEDNVYQAYLINRNYYQTIWDSCSDEEKSILYDIAEDFVINLHKKGVINELINKGLVLNGQFLMLFNLSFTHFVNSQKDEVDTINVRLRDDSNTSWSQYSLPIKLLGIAIVVFLIVTQQEFLTRIQTLLISLGAILTFALRFINFPVRNSD